MIYASRTLTLLKLVGQYAAADVIGGRKVEVVLQVTGVAGKEPKQ